MILEPVLRWRDISGVYTSRLITLPVSIAQSNEPKLGSRIDDQVFRHPADVGHSQACPHHELDDEVAISDAP